MIRKKLKEKVVASICGKITIFGEGVEACPHTFQFVFMFFIIEDMILCNDVYFLFSIFRVIIVIITVLVRNLFVFVP